MFVGVALSFPGAGFEEGVLTSSHPPPGKLAFADWAVRFFSVGRFFNSCFIHFLGIIFGNTQKVRKKVFPHRNLFYPML